MSVFMVAVIKVLGVVGNRDFASKGAVGVLIMYVRAKFPNAVVVSGGAEGADSFAEEYCKEFGVKFEAFRPASSTRDEFFARNGKIAARSDNIVAFVNEGRYRCGTFNTLNQFTRLKPSQWFAMVNERGELWRPDEMPWWLRKRNPALATTNVLPIFAKQAPGAPRQTVMDRFIL